MVLLFSEMELIENVYILFEGISRCLKYQEGIVNENNIFRILGDMISESTGTMGYGYSMNENYLESLFGEKDILKRVICKVIPQNESEWSCVKI